MTKFVPQSQHSYTREEIVACSNGELFGEGNAKLPADNMLMVDRITRIHAEEGEYGKGLITAELDIKKDLWFFGCHFHGDPVMPGCLGLDAMWQLTGFSLHGKEILVVAGRWAPERSSFLARFCPTQKWSAIALIFQGLLNES